MPELTDEQILTVSQHRFRDGHTADPAKLRAYCDAVRTVIACYNLEPVTSAARDVLAERRRQVEQEGWTPAHDDQHRDHELSCAAGCYAMYTLAYPAGDPPPAWPWAADWWKPTTHRRNLVKAGALIQAAIEQIDRRAVK
ncbi:putative gp37 [Burkholderia pseudomallei MSHR3951]|nr:putative gp37 [Burkholderia pseudomallei MSHR3951]